MLVEQPKLAITKRHNVRMRDCGSPAAKIVKRAKQQHDHKAVHYDMEVWVKQNRGSLCMCVTVLVLLIATARCPSYTGKSHSTVNDKAPG
jgi:hypothetical protein